jgi:two-component system cell cycle sensor histidine kinase/response regulator CckA
VEGRLRTLLESVPDAVVIVSENGAIVHVNSRTEELFGYTRRELLGRPVEILVPERFREAHRIHRSGYSAAPRARSMGAGLDLYGLRQDGREFPVEISLSPLAAAGGRLVSTFIRDLTERRGLEAQLRQAQRMEAIGRLAGGVAHDFNNLLTVIMGHCELLQGRLPEGDATRRGIEEIRSAGERAASLTRQLLAFSRRQVLAPKVLDLNAVVGSMAPMLRRLIGEDIELRTALATGLGHVKTDPGQIEQVIMNLVVNARDAMPRGGKITIETANVTLDKADARRHVVVRPGTYVRLCVSDTGTGMDAATQARIFEPFFTTKEPGKGTGLGLSTVYGVIKQSGGYIWVYSEPGQGATFKIYVPQVGEEFEGAEATEPRAAPRRGAETVLLVEDEDGVRSLAREILEAQGYTVLEAGQAAEALQICERHEGEIHLLLTDVVMPQTNGPALAARAASLRPGMRVLYMSGYTANAIAHHGVLDVGVAYLQKPFTVTSLAQKVRESLDAPPTGTG